MMSTTHAGAKASEAVRETFIAGLRNAHALENQALSIMKRQLERLESYPQVAARLRQHIAETEGQQDRVARILESLGESSSGLKDMAMSFTGTMAALNHAMAEDEIIKNSLANYAFENFEAASYISLITMAEEGGFHDAILLLQQNLEEEEAMAAWAKEGLPEITRRYLTLHAAGEQAKR
jgi:ferritin-like metal-binding protein YciE